MAFPISKAAAFILAYPAGMVAVELIDWLQRVGVRAIHVENNRTNRHIVVGYNLCVRRALDSAFDHFIFADNDMRPSLAETAPFLAAAGDIVACKYPTECGEAAWPEPSGFHTGLWRSARRVLEAIEPPWFLPSFSEDGCRVLTCECALLPLKAQRAGFTVRHAGWAGHTPRQSVERGA
jgi:hypothetical protein